MKILAIETSCDETGLSIIDTETHDNTTTISVVADILLSQAMLHAEYGGVYPTLAKREHAKNLGPLLLELLKKAKLFAPSDSSSVSKDVIGEIKTLLDREPELFVYIAMVLAQAKKPPIDAIAVTRGPGLEPALWVGVNFARALSKAWDIPILPINHMEGHVAAALATGTGTTFTITPPALPTLILLISGGHTEFVLMKNWLEYEKVGTTRDDAVGEAFDKSARLLGLGYPGGPQISKLAAQAREQGLEQPYSLPRPMLHSDDLDFSFSGLKTAVRNLVETVGTPDETQKMQIARELEEAITETLVSKTKRAIEQHGAQSLVVGGGVSASTYICAHLKTLVEEYEGMQLYIPTPELATDNGRMIAFAAAMRQSVSTPTHADDMSANGNLSIADL